MIFYPTTRLIREAQHRATTLIEVMHDADLIAERYGWKKLLVTSMFRTLEENRAAKAKSIVHCCTPHRAVDFRIWGVGSEIVKDVTNALNAKWEYDFTRPSMPVAYSEPHGDGPHLHLQVHPNTRRR